MRSELTISHFLSKRSAMAPEHSVVNAAGSVSHRIKAPAIGTPYSPASHSTRAIRLRLLPACESRLANQIRKNWGFRTSRLWPNGLMRHPVDATGKSDAIWDPIPERE